MGPIENTSLCLQMMDNVQKCDLRIDYVGDQSIVILATKAEDGRMWAAFSRL
jgi:hypothetical protein